MEEKEYLSEEEYQKNNAKVKRGSRTLLIIGGALIATGIITAAVGFISFGTGTHSSSAGSIGNLGLFALGGFLLVIGFPVAFIGGMGTLLGHRREIAAYTTQQVMPLAKEGIEKITPTVADSAGDIAKSVAKGIKEGLEDKE